MKNTVEMGKVGSHSEWLTSGEFALALVIGGIVSALLIWATWTFAGWPVVSVEDCLEYGRRLP